jgi:hypothetical protein
MYPTILLHTCPVLWKAISPLQAMTKYFSKPPMNPECWRQETRIVPNKGDTLGAFLSTAANQTCDVGDAAPEIEAGTCGKDTIHKMPNIVHQSERLIMSSLAIVTFMN